MKKKTKTTKAAGPAAAKTAVKAPAAKAPARKITATTITARLDVGFGNTLYLRGEGPGLSWDRGVPMDCVADDKWVISLSGAAKPVLCKVLINDLTWCAGDDYVVQPGASVTLTPKF